MSSANLENVYISHRAEIIRVSQIIARAAVFCMFCFNLMSLSLEVPKDESFRFLTLCAPGCHGEKFSFGWKIILECRAEIFVTSTRQVGMEFSIIFARSKLLYLYGEILSFTSPWRRCIYWEGIVYGNENIIFFFCSLVPFLFSLHLLSCVLCALYPEYIHAAAMLFYYY